MNDTAQAFGIHRLEDQFNYLDKLPSLVEIEVRMSYYNFSGAMMVKKFLVAFAVLIIVRSRMRARERFASSAVQAGNNMPDLLFGIGNAPDKLRSTAVNSVAPFDSDIVPALLLSLTNGHKSKDSNASLHGNELLAAIFKYSPDVIWAKETRGTYIACSRSAAIIFRRKVEDIVGKSDENIFSVEVAAHHRETDLQVIAKGESFVEEQSYGVGEGHSILLEMMKSPIFDANGAVVGVLGVARDITQRRQHEQKTREQEKLLRQMSELAHVGGWEIDVTKNMFSFSAELARIHELDPDKPLGVEVCIANFKSADRARLEDAMALTLETGKPCDLEAEVHLPSGRIKWVRAHWRATKALGKVTRIWGMLQDVTERRKLDESIRMADLIYKTTSGAIFVTDKGNVIVDANPAALRLLGYTLDEVVGRMPREFVADPNGLASFERIADALVKSDSWEGKVRCRHKEGTLVDVRVDISILRDVDSDEFRRAIHVVDLTEQKRKDEQLWRKTNFDTLTGMPNRGLFLDRLEEELKKAAHVNSRVGVMCIDIDRFRQVNSILGHLEGDQILVEIASRIRKCVPGAGTVSRIGGDRFALFVRDEIGRANLELIAEDLIEDIVESIYIASRAKNGLNGFHVTASAGISVFPDDSECGDDLMRASANALQEAKKLGGNCFQYSSPILQHAARQTLELANDLRYALEKNQLIAYYQPIIDSRNNQICKAEVLLRWMHPAQGMISPSLFIPLAEQTGLIIEIGEWVLNEAIACFNEIEKNLGLTIELSVNVSTIQFAKGKNCAWIDRLTSHRLPERSIAIEITESSLMEDSDQLRRCLRELQSHGLRVSLDDFGTGFSSLSYLKKFSVDYLKIDQSFIRDLDVDSENKALTHAIINMSHQLGIETIAEGIETREQRDIVVSLGCDFLQGFFYSRPLPKEELLNLLHAEQGDK